MIEYRELAPSAALAAEVKCFWTLRGGLAAAESERILPDGCFELVIHLGIPFVRDGMVQPESMLVGELRRPTHVTMSTEVSVFGVRFRPGGLAPFVGVPARVLCDLIVPAEELFPRGMRERCLAAPSTRERAAIVESVLLRARRERRGEALVRAAVERIDAADGALRMGELPRQLGTTDRTLLRRFDDCVGIPPKVYARLVRFRASLAQPSGADSYYDDAHALRDFHEFGGATPTALRAEVNALNDAFVGNFQDSGTASALT